MGRGDGMGMADFGGGCFTLRSWELLGSWFMVSCSKDGETA